MTREEAKEFIAQSVKSDVDMALVADAIKALEQEPCEDAVSREAVLDLIADYDLSMGQVVRSIHALPSVTSQELIKKLEKQIKQLQNRCHALTHGHMCVFCPYECEHKAEVEPQKSEDKE